MIVLMPNLRSDDHIRLKHSINNNNTMMVMGIYFKFLIDTKNSNKSEQTKDKESQVDKILTMNSCSPEKANAIQNSMVWTWYSIFFLVIIVVKNIKRIFIKT